MADRTMALTIWQPWASLIMSGAKPYEFRRWPAPRGLHGSRIAILGAPIRCTEMTEAQGVDSDRVDHHMWAWPVTEIERLEPFVPGRGAQGFWPWP